MSQKPTIKHAQRRDLRKAFGPNTEQMIEVFNNNADCLTAVVVQVEKLTVSDQKKADQISAILDGLKALQDRVDAMTREASV